MDLSKFLSTQGHEPAPQPQPTYTREAYAAQKQAEREACGTMWMN